MSKKILMLGWGYPPNIEGGLDIHVAELVDCLRSKDKFEVTLALPSFKSPDDDRGFIESVDSGSKNVYSVAQDISGEVASLASDFDIIHTHDWFGAEAGYKAQKYSNTYWVSTIHSLSSDRSRGVSEDIEKLEKVACEKPDKLISVSKGLMSEIESLYNIEDGSVIHNGFSEPSSSNVDIREKLGINDSEDIIFFVGRHAEQKGIEHLIYGFSKYLESGNNAYLVLGGDGHLRDDFEDFVDLLGIDDNVIFEGFIDDKILGDYYQCADVFVSPSISEPFGLTITEALSSGTFVLSTESGVEEILPQNLVKRIKPDSDSIKNGLEEVLETSMHINSDFDSRTWEAMSEEVCSLYEELLS